MKKNRRIRLLADLKIQGGLCLRLTIYWFACYVVTIGTVLGFACLEGPANASGPLSRFIVPGLIAAGLVLPLAWYDVLVFSNRFSGPILNFRRRFQAMADGDYSEQVHFRSGDYLNDLAENYNKIRERLLQYESVDEFEAFESFDEREVTVSGGV